MRIRITIIGGISKVAQYIWKSKGWSLHIFTAEPYFRPPTKNLEIYITDDDELKIGFKFAPPKTDVADALENAEDKLWDILNELCRNVIIVLWA
ncbi:hypothetical protein D9758_014535 [Tetrapyrgos nigripes]|uniref:Uncharacterized protein n=1 Tax=Tetrapyrgos nigripes TaxID=182062 RepID=A0A8H5CT99_9AGAR|nr:hypothetical protein D9758_014535 [Tetrapyrgos nigripes]